MAAFCPHKFPHESASEIERAKIEGVRNAIERIGHFANAIAEDPEGVVARDELGDIKSTSSDDDDAPALSRELREAEAREAKGDKPATNKSSPRRKGRRRVK